VMDSRTIGIPLSSPEGYKDHRLVRPFRVNGSGVYVHSAPWSVDSTGVYANVSHGCHQPQSGQMPRGTSTPFTSVIPIQTWWRSRRGVSFADEAPVVSDEKTVCLCGERSHPCVGRHRPAAGVCA